MKVITIKQPWAWLICSGVKDIENRTRKISYRGRILIHASAKQYEIQGLLNQTQQEHLICKLPHKMPIQNNIVNSAIIGSVEIVDCVINHSSVWAEKTMQFELKDELSGDNGKSKPIYNWVLSNPILFEKPIENIKGKLSLWDFDMDYYEVRRLSTQI